LGETAVIKVIPATDIERLQFLVLGRADQVYELTHRLDEDAQLEQVEAFQQAMEALRSKPFDVMILQAADAFPPIQDTAPAEENDSTSKVADWRRRVRPLRTEGSSSTINTRGAVLFMLSLIPVRRGGE